MCGVFWTRYRCGHGVPLFAICECKYPNFGCQHNLAADPHRTPDVLVERPYNCRKCMWLGAEGLCTPKGWRGLCERDEVMTVLFGQENAVLEKHGGGERTPELGAGYSKTKRSDTEKPGQGSSKRAQHEQCAQNEPSAGGQRSHQWEAPPQQKSPRRCSGSVNPRTEAPRQSSSSHLKSSRNAPSSSKVAKGPSRPVCDRDRLPSQRHASNTYRALPPGGMQQVTNRPAANGVPHAVAEPTIQRHRPGARNEEKPRRAPRPNSRHSRDNHLLALEKAARLSTIHEEPHNEEPRQPNDNYWDKNGLPGFLRPPHIAGKEYHAVRPDNPSLSSPKPPLRDSRQSLDSPASKVRVH